MAGAFPRRSLFQAEPEVPANKFQHIQDIPYVAVFLETEIICGTFILSFHRYTLTP